MTEQAIMKTFKIFSILNANGKILKDNARAYATDDEVNALLMRFAKEVDCTVISADQYLYLVPLNKNSIYHMSNDVIKKNYFPSRALNKDVYLMYVAIIVFIGEFYNSYQSDRPTRDFITTVDWLRVLNERLGNVAQMDESYLKEMEEAYEYNWCDILENWSAMDNVKEGIKRKTARTVSRMSFIMIVKNFMIKEGIAKEIGPDELTLTDKTKAIVTQYFMDYEYNRGILAFIYDLEKEDA